MRVCYISTYPPIECGLATYTQYLSDAMRQLDKEVIIVSQVGAKGFMVFPTYSPSDNDISAKLMHMSSKLTPDVIHIQLEFGLFGSDSGVQIIDYIIRCKLSDTPVVTTLHTVSDKPDRTQKILLENIMHSSSAIIVHEDHQKETLKKYFGNENKIHVIPHRVRDCKKIRDAKKILNLENKKIILLAGYFRSTKCFHKMVEIFPKIADKIDNAILLVAGKTRILEHNDYLSYFFELINNSPAKNRIEILYGQFPQHTFDTILSAADVIVLPYELGAQSGILAHSSAFNIPVVTSDLLSFKLWNKETKGGLTAYNDGDYVKHISKILTDEDFAKELQNNIKKYNKNILWHPIAQKHLQIYEKLINFPYGKAKFFYVPNPDEGKEGQSFTN